MATMQGVVADAGLLRASRSARRRPAAESDSPSDGSAATEQALRVKQMQRALLEQIEEQKRLQAELLQRSAAGAPFTVSAAAARPPPRAARKAAAAAPPAAREAEAPRRPSPPPRPPLPPAPASSFAVDAAAAAARAAPRAPPPAPAAETAAPAIAPAPAAAAAAAAEPLAAKAKEEEEEAPPPPLCKERLNVVLVAMECAPWSKTGGLGDVAGALPKALAKRGHRTMCVAPRYENYAEGWETGVRARLRVLGSEVEVGFFHGFIDGVDYVFVDHACFHAYARNLYGGDRSELQFRCALLCQAALEVPWLVPCGGVPYGDENLVFLANDWHTALLPVYLQAFYRDHGKLTFARCCLVIHNMAHQGRAPLAEFGRLGLPDGWREAFRLDDPVGGVCMNIFKAGIIAAHRLIAVSEGYAWECATDMGGWGLAPTLREQGAKLCGVVNGIDTVEWSPELDPHLKADGYVNYTPDAAGMAGKAACKAALQRQLGLPERPDVPLIGFIGRLDYQKGVDLICNSTDHIVGQGAQLVMLGSGTAELEGALRGVESRHRNAARCWVGFSASMAHRITAGADILLMPSRFEPCGLNQLYAMRYGTVPVVHAVGGLRDTVQPFQPFDGSGTGWTFSPADSGKMNEALGHAMHTYRAYPESFRGIQLRGMARDLSWDTAAQKYEDQLLGAKYSW